MDPSLHDRLKAGAQLGPVIKGTPFDADRLRNAIDAKVATQDSAHESHGLSMNMGNFEKTQNTYRAALDLMAYMQESYNANKYVMDILRIEMNRLSQINDASRTAIYKAQKLQTDFRKHRRLLVKYYFITSLAFLELVILFAASAAYAEDYISRRVLIGIAIVLLAIFTIVLLWTLRGEGYWKSPTDDRRGEGKGKNNKYGTKCFTKDKIENDEQ